MNYCSAERAVGLIKSLAARALATANLDSTYWSYSVRYASQCLLCHALQLRQRSLPFGSTVVAQVLGHRDIKFPDRKSITGRLLYWNHLEDHISYTLCPPEGPDLDAFVYRAGLPVKLPPGINIDELPRADPLPLSFTKPLARYDPTPMVQGIQLTLILRPEDSRSATVDERSSLPSSSDQSLQEKEATDDHDHDPRNENDDDTDDDVLVEYP